MTTKSRGDWGEALVAEWLREHGYAIVASKYRCRFGEIDLIARDKEMLCFVEVKLRDRTDYGLPREFVTAAKQRRLRTTAEFYLSRHDPDVCCRFDVAEVYADAGQTSGQARIEYFENAF
ncbi:MAG: YraN family protein [Ruminococcaceae bacterium]|nr:YraN family protein [Oscillospiraceae bacterium]